MRALTMASAALAAAALCATGAHAGDHEVKRLSLLPGDQAPAIEVTDWVKGEEVAAFDKGQVYVVDFWATWCGPCIASMPHLTSVQESHPETVKVIAVNIWEGKDLSPEDRAKRVRAKVHDLGDSMNVRVGIDGTKAMEQTWMRAAARNGIPSTFIVDQGGRVAWIGHPIQMDEALEAILDGTFDVTAFRAEYKTEMEPGVRIAELWDLLRAEQYDAFSKTANAYLDTYLKDDADQLNGLAWEVTTSEDVKQRDLDFAKKAATRACELTDWKDPAIVDTYAHVLFAQGDVDGAIKFEKKALKLCGPDTPEELTASLREALARFQGTAKEASLR